MNGRVLPFAACLASLMLGFSIQAVAGSLEEVGRNDLDRRGMNAALAIGDHCAYVGSRSDDPPLVVDIADPAHPRLAGQLAAHRGSTSRELRVVPAARLLVIMHYAIGGTVNQLDFYRWTDDCRRPVLVGRYDFGSRRPHEFYLWEDPARPDRVLLFVAMSPGRGQNLDVIDASNPGNPTLLASWDIPDGLTAGALLHSIALSADGRIAFLSLWTGGLLVADSSDFTSGSAGPRLRLITPVGNALRYPGNVHSAVPLPGSSLVLLTDEQYGGCPYGWARLADISDPVHPRILSTLQVPENDVQRCRTAPNGTWTSHDPTLTAHLALVSWYSAGLQVFDLTDPVHPASVAQLRPAGTTPRRQDPQLGGAPSMTWSYPVIRDGLIYLADINHGLLVLRYRGIYEDEISGLAFAEGNSNLTRARLLLESPPPTSAPGLQAETSKRPLAPSAPSSGIGWLVILAIGAVGLGLLIVGVAVRLSLMKGRGMPGV